MTFADRELWSEKEVAKLAALLQAELRSEQELLENLPAGVLVVSRDLALLAANGELRRLFGLGHRPLGELRFADLFPDSECGRRVLEALESPGWQISFDSAQERPVRVRARSYVSWRQEPRAILLVVDAAPPTPAETEPRPAAPQPRPMTSRPTAAGGWQGGVRAGVVLAFVIAGIARRLLFGPRSPRRTRTPAPAKVLPFPPRAAEVPEAEQPRRTGTD